MAEKLILQLSTRQHQIQTRRRAPLLHAGSSGRTQALAWYLLALLFFILVILVTVMDRSPKGTYLLEGTDLDQGQQWSLGAPSTDLRNDYVTDDDLMAFASSLLS